VEFKSENEHQPNLNERTRRTLSNGSETNVEETKTQLKALKMKVEMLKNQMNNIIDIIFKIERNIHRQSNNSLPKETSAMNKQSDER
jgi:hypothetical protein